MIEAGDARPSVNLERFFLPLLVRQLLPVRRGAGVVHVLVADCQPHEYQRVGHHDAGEGQELVPLWEGKGENQFFLESPQCPAGLYPDMQQQTTFSVESSED